MTDTLRKTIFYFSKCSAKLFFPKKSNWYMIFLVLSAKMICLFPENMILFFRRKRKDDLSQKDYLEIWCFLQMFWKDGLSKKFSLDHGLFCNIWQYGISFFREIWYFFLRRKMKENDLYQKIHGNMIFSVYMHKC